MVNACLSDPVRADPPTPSVVRVATSVPKNDSWGTARLRIMALLTLTVQCAYLVHLEVEGQVEGAGKGVLDR